MDEMNNNPFKILNETENSATPLSSDTNQSDLNERIKELINGDKIVLFMKGNANFPQCGFSANAIAILKHLNLEFSTFDILQDMEIRQGLKEYSNWPTFPQLYANGELIGGNDIMTELFENGELQEVLK